MKTHNVLLQVNTKAFGSNNARENLRFDGQSSGSKPEDYTIYVDEGDEIIFKGVSSVEPEKHTVQIKSINYEGGENVFDKNVLKDSRDEPGVVRGVVRQGTGGSVEKFTIKFRIEGDDRGDRRMYHLDPKIEVRKARTRISDSDGRGLQES